jgi:hypothetical protein
VALAAVAVVGLAAVAVVALAGCGGDDSGSLVKPPPPPEADQLYGTWAARQPGGYNLRYVFRRDRTYEHSQGTRQRRREGTYLFEITTRGTIRIRGDTVVLRPRSGTQVRRDPADPAGDYRRPAQKLRQRYTWSVRGTGANARLTMSIGGGLAVTYRRR